MTALIGAMATAAWLGILTSISPCPLTTNIAAISFVSKRVTRPSAVLLAGVYDDSIGYMRALRGDLGSGYTCSIIFGAGEEHGSLTYYLEKDGSTRRLYIPPEMAITTVTCPIRVEVFTARLVDTLIGMSTKVIPLSL